MIQTTLHDQKECFEAQIIRTGEQLQECVNECTSGPFVTFDTETTGFHTWKGHRIFSFGTKIPGRPPWYLSFREEHPLYEMIPEETAIRAIKDICENAPQMIAHNAKFDLEMLRVEGINPKGFVHDSMVMAYLDNENFPKGLDDCVRRYHLADNDEHFLWKSRMKEIIQDLADQTNRKKTDVKYSEINSFTIADYCVRDVCFTEQIAQKLLPQMSKYGSELTGNLYQIECELLRVLVKMEANGVWVDQEKLEDVETHLAEDIEKVQIRINEMAGGEVDCGKPRQLIDLLYHDMHIPIPMWTSGNQPAVNKQALEYLKHEYPIAAEILEWRELSKLKSTYTRDLWEKCDEYGFLHASFNSMGPTSGRFSCAGPNLQNIPKTSKIRQGFGIVDREGYSITRLMADYSQIQLRGLAWVCHDENLTRAFMRGLDLHQEAADFIFGVPPSRENARGIAKNINFGISFGLTPKGLARKFYLPADEAQQAFDRHEEFFPRIKTFREDMWKKMRENEEGEFVDPFGRHRRIPNIHSTDEWEVGAAERAAIASYMQMIEGGVMKKSLVAIDKMIVEKDFPAWICMTIHDDLSIDCATEVLPEIAKEVKFIMEDFPWFEPIPILVDFETTTTNWAEKKSYKLPN